MAVLPGIERKRSGLKFASDAIAPLKKAVPAQAARFALAHSLPGLPHSAAMSLLRRAPDADVARAFHREMLIDAGVSGKPFAEYDQDDFLRLTKAVAQWGIGDSIERTLLAASTIAHNGYPYPMLVMRCNPSRTANLDHVFLLICAAPDADHANMCLDPLIACLTAEEQRGYTGAVFADGDDSPMVFHQARAKDYLHCYLVDDAGPRIRRSSDIPGMTSISALAEIRLGDDGVTTFRILAK